MTVAANRVRPAFTDSYGVAGRKILVEAPSGQISRATDRFFSMLRVSHVPSAPVPSPAAIIQISAGPFELPAGMTRCGTSEEAEYYQGKNFYFVRLKNSRITAGATSTVSVVLDPTLDHESFQFGRILSHALSMALRRAKAFELHCAAVVEPESGLATLIVGPSGSGKSTLALHLAAGGWDFSTDDVALLTEEDGVVEAHGLRECFALTSETAFHSGISRLKSASKIEDKSVCGVSKIMVLPQEIFSSNFVKQCVPSVLIFPHQTGENGSRVQRLSQPDVMKRLLQICPWALVDTPTAADFQRVLGLLTRQCAAFALFAGTELLEEPEYTTNYIAAIMRKRAA